MTDKETFLFSKWNVEVHRRAFRRSIALYIYPNKPIKIIAAKNTPQKVIVDFLLTKKEWIEKAYEKLSRIAEKFPDKKIRALEKFPFLGVDRCLKVVITLHQKTFVSISDDHLLLHIPRNQWSAEAQIQEHPTALREIRHFYKREAVQYLTQRVQFWAEQMQLFPAQLRFKEQRTRWGSCSSRKSINLNWRLIVFNKDIIDYVIVHELAHLAHMNHSERFWSLVEVYIGNYRERVRSLKESQYLVEFLSE